MRIVLLAAALAVLAFPSGAGAAELVVRDSQIAAVQALDGQLFYSRMPARGREPLRRAWMRVIDGRSTRARGVPRGANPGAITSIGRDAAGRVVAPLAVVSRRAGRITARWWLYDLRADRARPMRHVPGGRCAAEAVAIWRGSVAWSDACGARHGVFLRRHGRTRRVSRGAAFDLALRRGTLVGTMEAAEDSVLARLAARGRRCETILERTHLPEEWGRGGLWLVGDDVVSFDFDSFALSSAAFVGTELPRGCGAPGATGAYELPPLPFRTAGSRAIDGGSVYYAADDGIHRLALPARFRTEPPPNDDFEHAEPLADAPVALTLTLGNATLRPGEPQTPSRGTVWYAFRPQVTRRVWISAHPVRVFSGPGLTPVGVPEPNDGPLRVDAVAGETYWIQLGCWDACYLPAELRIDVAVSAPL